MKNKTALLHLGVLLALLVCSNSAALAKGTPLGDIMLIGNVERAGQRLVNDTTLFEGDTIRTLANSGGVVRIGRGRLELNQNSEVEIVSVKPLKLVVKSGGMHFNFPVGTDFEIVTPQLDIHPVAGVGGYSGVITAQPKKEDRVTSRVGRYSILEREVGGDTNTIHEGQVLIASLVLPALPQAVATTIATITQFDPPTATQVNVARAASPKNFSIRGTVGMDLANGDVLRDLQGNARIEFKSDGSVITLRPGTQVTIEEKMENGSLLRSISQYAGTLWFSITKATGSGSTKLSTPTAVAAIRGTEGENTDAADSTTFALREGIEDITENLTGNSVTIRSGQTVTAIRGVGFTAVSALLGTIGPSVGGAGPGGPGGGAGAGGGGGGAGGAGAGGAGGGGAGAGGGGVAGAGTGVAATTTTTAAAGVASTVSSVGFAALGAGVAGTAAYVGTTHEEPTASPSRPFFTCPGNLDICPGL